MQDRVLLIKMSSLGDVVHAMPAVTDAVNAGYRIDWVVEEAFADLVAMHPSVDRVIPVAWRRWRKQFRQARPQMWDFYRSLRLERYQHIIDSQGLIKSAMVSLLAKGGGERYGFSHTVAREPWAAFAYHRRHVVPRAQHAIDRQRQLFSAALNYALPINESSGLAGLRLMQTARESKQVILLHGTTWASKHWPQNMWQELVALSKQAGFEPVVTWGNEVERSRAELLAGYGASIQPKVSLSELLAVLQNAALVIGVDSGLCHLSAALGTPTLGLYGPTSARLTGCRGQRAQALQGQAPCVPCIRPTCTQFRGDIPLWKQQPVQPPCFATLSPEVVWRQAHGLLGQGS